MANELIENPIFIEPYSEAARNCKSAGEGITNEVVTFRRIRAQNAAE